MAISPLDPIAAETHDALATTGNAAPTLDLDKRGYQIFPTLSPGDVKQMLRFGQQRTYQDGEPVIEAGKTCYGLMLVLKGALAMYRTNGLNKPMLFTTHTVGQFAGEVAQLSGRAPLANGYAVGATDVLVVPPE